MFKVWAATVLAEMRVFDGPHQSRMPRDYERWALGKKYQICHFLDIEIIFHLLLQTTADLVNNCLHCLYMDIEILRAIRMAYYGNANEEWDSFLKLKHTTRVKAYRSTDQFYTFTKQMSTLVPYSAKVSQYNFDLIADIHSILTAFSYKPSLDTP